MRRQRSPVCFRGAAAESGSPGLQFSDHFYDRHPIFSFNFLNINRKLGASTPLRLLHEPVLPNDLTVRRIQFLLRFSFAAFRSTLMYG